MNARILAAAIALVMLASCGGGGGSAGVAPSNPGLTGAQIVKFNFKVPAKSKQIVRKKLIGGKYVSPATLGLGLTYSTTSATFTAAQLTAPTLALDLSTCTSTTYSTCTMLADGSENFAIEVPIPPGSYTYEFVTWDCKPSGTPPAFSGNQLSTAISTLVVTAGGASQSPNFVLNGLPASVVLSPAPSQAHLIASGTGYQLVGPTAETFFLNALDADGFVITGLGAPTLSMSDATGSFAFAQNVSSPNVFTAIAKNAALQNTNGVTVTYAAAGSGIATVSGTTTLIPVPELWIASGTTVNGYLLNVTTGATPSESVGSRIDTFTASGATGSLGTDSAGNIWVTNAANIQEYNAPSFLTPPTYNNNFLNDPCGGSDNPSGMAFDANGLMWFTSPTCPANGAGVYAYNPAALGSPVLQLTTPAQSTLGGATSVAIAPSTSGVPSGLRGTIFVGTNTGSPGVDILTASGTTLTDTYPGAYTFSGKQATVGVGTDGTVWIYDGTYLNALAMVPNGSGLTITPIGSPTSQTLSSTQMAADPIGQIWFGTTLSAQAYMVSGGAVVAGTSWYVGTPVTGVAISP